MKTLGEMFLLLLLAGLGAGGIYLWHPQAPSPGQTGDLEEYAVSLGEIPDAGRVLWLDARTQEVFLQGHVPGALLVNLEDWQAGLDRVFSVWEPGRPVVVYCSSAGCHASAQVAARLRKEFEATNIYHLREGWEGWLASGRPIELGEVSYGGAL